MAVLVTRPQGDGEATADRLRSLGFEVLLAPVLRFEVLPFQEDDAADYDAVIVTSANALRAAAPQLAGHALLRLPLFAVGDHTAAAAREGGFGEVASADGDATALYELVRAHRKAKKLKKAATLLYLAGADLSRDLAGELGDAGFTVITRTTYRMSPVAGLPRPVCDAFMAGGIEAVLHYSRRSARAFLDAARAEGLEISALALPHCCISAAVAAVLREAGATQVVTAASPDENALFEALTRALRP
ncbi:uroporphyrinogen-III synthase [Bradyrhizobium neotropicale]|uniref:uroporphyrinogen-III synthase n=1 Tax=Bradyrhizobium neotropicale TaxID=1497615 RepID=UPI001AD711FB|nr:uroporphyrinogen-III synthase [Bradyrhizobium neotropicale]MBO4222817.1 uroporphyrinogen-III synthase [Bradyrhizobium neotropicale]